MAEPLFWVVWRDGGDSPSFKHRDFVSARAEAQRLARKHKGHRFVVLAAVLGYQHRDLDELRYQAGGVDMTPAARDCDDDIPF